MIMRSKPKKKPDDFEGFDIDAAREKVGLYVDATADARRERKIKQDGSIDRRTLRNTDRTQHLNFKATPAVKRALRTHVKKKKGSISAWLEEAIKEKLRSEGIDLDA